ncbi:NACHT, LRR and PYD domains-containing protein 3-like [Megalobrama amblycephala]|uniref:NACHT, LRR and PYD domains-containing protein 3-like n=1 Tax=Megalobrama amblycephala TaxID=75352 RepID=UPI0020145963|nr:NACHT, LRR and PYD domains-containing protein 3-like [Megalobrama amblycephala]XP_048047744.1 NACHT, LRR and PYD domains-containing protein 3-like [Megalobrama amblycephala]
MGGKNKRKKKGVPVQTRKAASPEPSCVSMKSDASMDPPPKLNDGALTSDPNTAFKGKHCKMTPYKQRKERFFVQTHKAASPEPSCVSMKSDASMDPPPKLNDGALTSDPEVKSDDVIRSVKPRLTCTDFDLIRQRVRDQHKNSMKNKYESLFEGVNEEYEVLQMEKTARTQDTPIYCNDIFKPLNERGCEEKDKIKTVLTKGIAGIGKTFSVWKFILDWSKGKANQDVDFMFVLPFRELNLIKGHPHSLHRLLLDFHPEFRDLDSKIYEECKVVFIFDGLDESRITLMFSDDLKICDVNESSAVGLLMSNLISGDLLPSALIWITSRPAAANQIPSKYINRVTEIQGYRPITSLSSCRVKRDDVIRSVTPGLTCTDSDCQTLIRQRVRDQHKNSMKNKYESLFEGIKLEENQTLLNMIYTQLYIIEGESEGVNEEHEVLQMEERARTQDTPIYCNDIFKPLHERGWEEKDKIKKVLTKGIAGIGKTVSVQKFILDWSEGKANQDVDFMFVLPFRELNLIKDHKYSLHRLLLDFYPELQDLDSNIYKECKVVFIFDGLDESRITLMFSGNLKICDVNKSSEVGFLMSNLISGDLLPSALIWITSRPAAANQIPSKYINRVTEIQGFNEPQKEEYFRKRICDEHQASRIISHIRRSRSLHIMCHIPVFCWISATVLQNLLKQHDSAEIPQTLTEMYIHFLLTQVNMRNQKYEKDPEKLLQSNRDVIVKLAELAFKQLMKGNVMFYEEDLIESGIDITDASVYSGICTEIFKEESVFHQRKVYCFIHLSFQEFLAGFFVFYCHVVNNKESLKSFLSNAYKKYSKKNSLYKLLKAAVGISFGSNTGHLDLFLRFLLGISLESNQRLLQDLLTHTVNSSATIQNITQYIKDKIKGDRVLSADRYIRLFLCLLEMKDQTLYREIQDFMLSENHLVNKLSPGHCSTIAYMLQISDEVLDEFDLKKYNTSDEGKRRLIPAVLNCRKALLAGCNFTDQLCKSLSSCLQSSNSSLREVDLSNNDLQDSGVKLLSDGLKSSHCHLNILRLSGCMVTEKGCCYLASALNSNPSHLRELDLSYNHPGQSLVMLVSDPNYRLDKLNVDHGGEIRITAGLQKYACDLTLDLNTANTHLALSERNRKVTHVEEEQSYPDHPERFDELPQVLCRESLSGRCYWEAEWSGWADISMMYKGISRRGKSDDCWFGYNEKSWSLNCIKNSFTVRHNNKSTDISVPSHLSNRVGVYLDWLAGTLSFYSISETHTLTHLHTLNSKFTEPLYAGFGVYFSGSVSLCEKQQRRTVK